MSPAVAARMIRLEFGRATTFASVLPARADSRAQSFSEASLLLKHIRSYQLWISRQHLVAAPWGPSDCGGRMTSCNLVAQTLC